MALIKDVSAVQHKPDWEKALDRLPGIISALGQQKALERAEEMKAGMNLVENLVRNSPKFTSEAQFQNTYDIMDKVQATLGEDHINTQLINVLRQNVEEQKDTWISDNFVNQSHYATMQAIEGLSDEFRSAELVTLANDLKGIRETVKADADADMLTQLDDDIKDLLHMAEFQNKIQVYDTDKTLVGEDLKFNFGNTYFEKAQTLYKLNDIKGAESAFYEGKKQWIADRSAEWNQDVKYSIDEANTFYRDIAQNSPNFTSAVALYGYHGDLMKGTGKDVLNPKTAPGIQNSIHSLFNGLINATIKVGKKDHVQIQDKGMADAFNAGKEEGKHVQMNNLVTHILTDIAGDKGWQLAKAGDGGLRIVDQYGAMIVNPNGDIVSHWTEAITREELKAYFQNQGSHFIEKMGMAGWDEGGIASSGFLAGQLFAYGQIEEYQRQERNDFKVGVTERPAGSVAGDPLNILPNVNPGIVGVSSNVDTGDNKMVTAVSGNVIEEKDLPEGQKTLAEIDIENRELVRNNLLEEAGKLGFDTDNITDDLFNKWYQDYNVSGTGNMAQFLIDEAITGGLTQEEMQMLKYMGYSTAVSPNEGGDLYDETLEDARAQGIPIPHISQLEASFQALKEYNPKELFKIFRDDMFKTGESYDLQLADGSMISIPEQYKREDLRNLAKTFPGEDYQKALQFLAYTGNMPADMEEVDTFLGFIPPVPERPDVPLADDQDYRETPLMFQGPGGQPTKEFGLIPGAPSEDFDYTAPEKPYEADPWLDEEGRYSPDVTSPALEYGKLIDNIAAAEESRAGMLSVQELNETIIERFFPDDTTGKSWELNPETGLINPKMDKLNRDMPPEVLREFSDALSQVNDYYSAMLIEDERIKLMQNDAQEALNKLPYNDKAKVDAANASGMSITQFLQDEKLVTRKRYGAKTFLENRLKRLKRGLNRPGRDTKLKANKRKQIRQIEFLLERYKAGKEIPAYVPGEAYPFHIFDWEMPEEDTGGGYFPQKKAKIPT